MSRCSLPALGFLLASGCLSAQSPLWERDFEKPSADAATADHDGNLWIVGHWRGSDRLVCITPNGGMRLSTELPREINPVFPADMSSNSLATSSSGVVALLTRYMHGGKTMYFDGANFAAVGSDGKLGPVKKVAGSGPDYKGFVALDNGHFLVLGDQSPTMAINIRDDGEIAWRRRLPSNWVLPSAAALDAGSSCIASTGYKSPLLRITWLAATGVIRHTAQFSGAGSLAASHGSQCTVLYSRRTGEDSSEYFLTSFDAAFKSLWTIRVLGSAPSGGGFKFAAVADGYIVSIDTKDGLFLAKYGATGRLLWSSIDPSRGSVRFIVPSGDGYYLIVAGDQYRSSLHVVRGR